MTDIVLLPCPFCGKQPNWKSKRTDYGTGASGMEPPMRALGCVNIACKTMPQTGWRDTRQWHPRDGWFETNFDQQAIADWNNQSALSSRDAEIERLRAALRKIIEMNVQYARDRFGDESQAEYMACVRVAREALNEQIAEEK